MFNAPLKNASSIYTTRLDYNLTRNGRHTIMWRGNLADIKDDLLEPNFPGQPCRRRPATGETRRAPAPIVFPRRQKVLTSFGVSTHRRRRQAYVDHTVRSVKELVAKIRPVRSASNASARPFIRTASADLIFQSAAAM